MYSTSSVQITTNLMYRICKYDLKFACHHFIICTLINQDLEKVTNFVINLFYIFWLCNIFLITTIIPASCDAILQFRLGKVLIDCN